MKWMYFQIYLSDSALSELESPKADKEDRGSDPAGGE